MVCLPHLKSAIVRQSPHKCDDKACVVEPLVIVAFISGVKCSLNASNTSINHLLSNTPGFVFHTTANQSFLSSLVIQSSGWHLSMISLGSCFVEVSLEFKIVWW